MNTKVMLAAFLSMLPGESKAEDYNIPIDTEGMREFQLKLRKLKAKEQLSKRKIKKSIRRRI